MWLLQVPHGTAAIVSLFIFVYLFYECKADERGGGVRSGGSGLGGQVRVHKHPSLQQTPGDVAFLTSSNVDSLMCSAFVLTNSGLFCLLLGARHLFRPL